MIETLMTGKLHGKPEQRTSPSTGRSYVQVRMRVAAGADEAHFVRVTAFSASACAALVALGDGDAVAVAGTLKPGAWIDRDGNAKPNLDVVAAQVLTAYHLKRRRESVQAAGDARSPERGRSGAGAAAEPIAAAGAGANDGHDFGAASDDDWLRGGER